MIQLTDVHKQLGGMDILKGMTFSVPDGQNYVLMGQSGIGKSVTLKHIVGVLRPDRGSIKVGGHEVPELDREGLMRLRRRMGYLFQNGALINWQTVKENVSLPLKEHGGMSKTEIEDREIGALQVVHMAGAADKLPSEISGGMRLRAGLARALVTEPEYVLYDEPNAGLDPIMANQIHDLIVEVRDRLNVTGLIVTHSRACAFAVANHIGVISDGQIAEEGTIEEMRESGTPLVRDFLQTAAD